jgi:hypothetical protein
MVLYLIAGFIGCGSTPKYAENSEVPWEVFYSVRTGSLDSDSSRLPFTFFIGGFVVKYDLGGSFVSVTNTEQGSEERHIHCSVPSDLREGFQRRFVSGKKYQLQIQKEFSRWILVGIDGVSLNVIIAELKAEHNAERQGLAAEERRQKEEERQQPRFSPEGKEYVKRTLIQAVGESRNQANRGKTLFFESSRIKVTNSTLAGQYLISDNLQNPNDYVLMEFYDNMPGFARTLEAGLSGGWITLYRVEINQLGVATFKIDSFRE